MPHSASRATTSAQSMWKYRRRSSMFIGRAPPAFRRPDPRRPPGCRVWSSRSGSGAAGVVSGGAFGARNTGSGCPSSLAKNVAMMCFATSAAAVPCSPCSANTTPAIRGLSRGAKNTNQPLSRRSFRCMPAAARPLFEMTCAVPVLPQTSLPGICATRAVPPALTTIHSPSRIAWRISGLHLHPGLRRRRVAGPSSRCRRPRP